MLLAFKVQLVQLGQRVQLAQRALLVLQVLQELQELQVKLDLQAQQAHKVKHQQSLVQLEQQV